MRAHDAAGNQSANSNSVTRTGQTGDTQAPTDRAGNLAFTQPAVGQIRLTWTASTDNVGVTGYDVYANGSLRRQRRRHHADLHRQPAGHAPRSPYYVRAKDAAGNVSGRATPSPAPAPAVRRHQPGRWASRSPPPPPPGSTSRRNANDDNLTTYWEGAGLPAQLTVALGANADTQLGRRQAQPRHRLGHAHPEHPGPRPRAERVGSFTSLAARRGLHVQPGHRQHGDHPGQRPGSPTSRLTFTANTGAPRRSGRRVPGLRHAGTEPGPDRHRPVRGPRPARSRPTRSRCRRPSSNSGTAASGRDQRQLLPRHHARSAPRTSARSRPARASTVTANIGAQNAAHLHADRARSTRRTPSSSRTTPTTPSPPRPTSWSRRCRAPT